VNVIIRLLAGEKLLYSKSHMDYSGIKPEPPNEELNADSENLDESSQ
jgi:hypothetical protein